MHYRVLKFLSLAAPLFKVTQYYVKSRNCFQFFSVSVATEKRKFKIFTNNSAVDFLIKEERMKEKEKKRFNSLVSVLFKQIPLQCVVVPITT